jgi:hypothetical protein
MGSCLRREEKNPLESHHLTFQVTFSKELRVHQRHSQADSSCAGKEPENPPGYPQINNFLPKNSAEQKSFKQVITVTSFVCVLGPCRGSS